MSLEFDCMLSPPFFIGTHPITGVPQRKSQTLWCNSQRWSGMYKRPLTSQNFIGLWKEKRYRRNMMFLFAGHSAGLLSKNFVKQRLHKNFRIPAPWLTKEIIFVCTVFLSFTLWMTCERTLIHAQSTSWIAPQNLQFTLWNSRLWDECLYWVRQEIPFWWTIQCREHLISKKPMQIDVLVKNEKHVKLKKNIGRIFR